MAKLIKVWDGSAWQTVGTASTVGAQGTTGTQGTTGAQGLTGAQGITGTSSSITTWVKTASGGETSLTGNSDSSTTLAYTAGQEQVFINGVLQVRGSDYTATNGTSITGLAALTAGDIATVTTVNAFSVTGAVPLSTVTANGDLIVGTSSGAVGRLGIGSTDQVLKVSGGVPVWATPAGGGKLLQVVSATSTTAYTNATTTLTDVTGLTATITPTSATSKILVMISASVSVTTSSGLGYIGARLLRGATQLVDWQGYGFMFAVGSGILSQNSIQYYDSPNTTSPTTYKMQARIDTAANSMTATWQYINTPSVITLFEIGV